VLILNEVKVVCFDTLLQVLILKGLAETTPASWGCTAPSVPQIRSAHPTPGILEKESGFA
jgi:hypothetical protein